MLLVSIIGIELGASPSQAADGVIEINQIRALAGGVTASDTPGFPITIDTPGSYALTGNLTVSGLDTTGVDVTTADVTLDLKGFTIQGGCPPVGCALDAGFGIGVDMSAQYGHHVRNGRVRGFAYDGVLIANRSRVSGLLAEKNGRDGIEAGYQIDIVDSRAVENARFGISASGQAKIRNGVADSNGQGGVFVVSDSTVTDTSARLNTTDPSSGTGIRTAIGCLVQRNVVTSNRRYGIHVEGPGGLVIENIAVGNGLAGIFLTHPGDVQGNTSSNNGNFGIALPQTGANRAAYRGNVVNGNAVGSVTGGINIGGNSCNGTGGCP